MKKILGIIVLFIIPLLLNSQLSGDGSYGSPWSGTLSGNATWSGTKYINGDITVDNEKLTVSSGAIIIFLAEGADLIITGTGQLEADGTTGSKIRFTSDDDNDGNYGETGERWGHISFQSMGAAGSSIIDNCVIEYGYKDDGSATVESFGGGVYAGFTDLIISNCEFRYNYAGYGGGIFIKDNSSPRITNNYIHNNTVSKGGGGIFIHYTTTSLIDNCLISYNHCSGSGGGGGLYIGPDASASILNSVICKNTTQYPSSGGDNILFLQNTVTPKPHFTNCIIWSSNYSVSYISQSPSTGDFNNCGIQNPVSGSTTSCYTLHATNTNSAGPNFATTDGTNWSIQPWSPCVDIGTSSDPDVPVNDYLGNGRIGPVDAGAYESQFYIWQGDDGSNPTLWNVAANWNSGSAPSGSENTYIPTGLTNYPVGSSSQDYTIGSGKQMIIERGAKVTLDDLTNNGTIKLNATSAGFASFILNSYSRGAGGTEEIQMFLTGGGTKTPLTYKWHYISPPVTSLAVSTFAPTYTLNIWGWFENRPTSTLSQGWVAYDGYISGGWDLPRAFNTLFAGKGYDYFKSTDYTYTFGGLFNTGDVNASLNYTTGNDNLYGYNLLGNPFSSGLDWNYIITHSFPANTSKGLYFTRNSVLCTYINSVGVPGDVTGIIPPMQGFFSKTYSAANTIILAAAARTHDNIHATYKGNKDLIPLVRLVLNDDSLSDETVVRFDELAKPYLDNDFDAIKFFLDPDLASIYTTYSGIDYTINGLPFPESYVEIPLTITLATDTIFKSISASQLQGLDSYNVQLIDNYTSTITDLKTTPSAIFSSSKGTLSDRFVLKISNVATSIDTPVQTDKCFYIYHGLGSINIQTVSDLWDGKSGSIKLLDITGKSVNDIRNAGFSKNSLTSIPAPTAKGLYIVEIQSGKLRYVGKVIVK